MRALFLKYFSFAASTSPKALRRERAGTDHWYDSKHDMTSIQPAMKLTFFLSMIFLRWHQQDRHRRLEGQHAAEALQRADAGGAVVLEHRRGLLGGDARAPPAVRDGLLAGAAPGLQGPPGLDRGGGAEALHAAPHRGAHGEPAQGAHLLQPPRPAALPDEGEDEGEVDAGCGGDLRLCRRVSGALR